MAAATYTEFRELKDFVKPFMGIFEKSVPIKPARKQED